MSLTRSFIASLLAFAVMSSVAPPAQASHPVPEWVKPAVRYLVRNGHMTRASFHANDTMRRAAFKKLMLSVFGRGYSRTRGRVRAQEVSRALVRVLGKASVAKTISGMSSPDGWSPEVTRASGFEVVAREMGLRYNRSGSEEQYEAWAHELIRQADVVYAVWRAKTSPSLWGADAVASFSLSDYDTKRRKVVKYALSLIGAPYVWAGEWPAKTGAGYPYGAQAAGGFDCSGFIWYVLKQSSASYSPLNRPYAGWALAERSSADMAAKTKTRLSYGKLAPGDLVFFSAEGRDARPASVYHAALYLGKGWIVHSSSGRAGISLAFIGRGSWWWSQIAWGRRVIA